MTATTTPDAKGRAQGGRGEPGRSPSSGTAPACAGDCSAAVIARAFAELHRQAHGGPVASCQRQLCASLTFSEAMSQVGQIPAEIRTAYQRNCTYFAADRLRAIIRSYIEGLSAIRVRPTGGVYFVYRAHAPTLSALHAPVARFGAGSHLARIPIPDQDEMREMVIAAFTTRARDDLSKRAADIATAQRDHASEATVSALHTRFRELQTSAAEHARQLNTSLDDTTAALQLVNAQLASLLSYASGSARHGQRMRPGTPPSPMPTDSSAKSNSPSNQKRMTQALSYVKAM